MFKHVRKINNDRSQSEPTTVSTSTAIFSDDTATWKIDLEPDARCEAVMRIHMT
jgi:hypothetical protein